MKSFKLFIFICLVLIMARADFEDCELLETGISGPNNTEITLSIKGSNEKISGTVNTKTGTLKNFKIGSNPNTYSGFLCVDKTPGDLNANSENSKEESDSSATTITSTRPCKKYLHFADSHLAMFSSKFTCYRYSTNFKTTQIFVLNKDNDGPADIYQQLFNSDSYTMTMKFLYSVLEFMSESGSKLLPIMEIGDDRYWMKGKNILFDVDDVGNYHFRYRFIDTSIVSKPSKDQIMNLAKHGFYLIKRFMYPNVSCKELVKVANQSVMRTYLEEEPTFPKNYRHIFVALEKQKDDEANISLSTKAKHRILLSLVAYTYCKNDLKYDMDYLHALKELVGSIFTEDQFFDTEDQKNLFGQWFAPDYDFSKTPTYKAPLEQAAHAVKKSTKKRKSEEQEIEAILDEPVVEINNGSQMTIEKGKLLSSRRLV